MPIDSSIALQTQAPADPLAQYGKALALRNAIQQGKSQDLQIQQQQADFDDQQKMRQAFQASGGDLNALEQNAIKLGVGPKTLMQLKDSILKQRESLAKIDSDELAVKKAHTEAIGAAAQGLLQLPTPEARAATYPQAISALVQQGRIKPDEVPAQYPGDEQIQQFANVARTSQQIIDSVLKERELKVQQDKQANEAPGQKADSDKKVLEAQLLKGATDGTAENAIIDRFAEKPEALKAALRAWKQNLPAGVQKATEEVNKIYDDTIGAPGKAAATIDAETTPKVNQQARLLPGQVKLAGAEAAATEPIRARANADAQAYLMKQTGGPLQNVMDPGERARVSNDYLKANDAYAEKASDAQRLKDFVAAARTGNQSAAGLMTISELRSVVNRVNTKELEQAGGASLVRSITNKLDKAGSGIPSEDTLKELEQVADLNNKTAAGAFAQKVRGIKAMSPKANLSETPIGGSAPDNGGWKVIGVK